MKTDYLRQKKELIPLVMFGASVVLAVLILMKTTSFFTTLTRAESIVKKANVQNNVETNDMDKYFTKYKMLAEALKKNNLFAPPPPKQHPVKEVSGIFGNEVLIKDRWYKVGDTVGDAKIVAIGPTQATIEWNGAEKVFLPFDATISETPKGTQAGKAVVKAGKADMVVIQSGRESMSDREGRTGLRKAFERMRERWPTIYEKQRKKLGAIEEKWPTMSEEQRETVGKWLEDPTTFEKTKSKK
ncbi:MAG TPA: hypothetical protein VMW72_23180 [Sedimentisphaerales bacterium]|nr:hypothetical protein [Sedimentisphaerales bacterium]